MASSAAFRFHESSTRMCQPEVFDQLTAAAQATDAYVDGWRWNNHDFQIKVVLNGSTSVEVMAEGSHDGTNWFNLDGAGGTLVLNVSDTYGYYFSNIALVQVRLTFVAETGGSNATIDVSYMGGK